TRFSRDWSSDVCSSDLLSGLLVFDQGQVACELLGAAAELERLPIGRRRYLDGEVIHAEGGLVADPDRHILKLCGPVEKDGRQRIGAPLARADKAGHDEG